MDAIRGFSRDDAKTKFTKSYVGSQTMKSHDCQCSEEDILKILATSDF